MMLASLSPTPRVGARKHGRHRGSFVGFWPSIAVVSAVDPPVSRLASSLNRDVTVSGAAALNSRYGDGSISLHAALELRYGEVRRNHLLRTWVNKGKKRKGRGVIGAPALLL